MRLNETCNMIIEQEYIENVVFSQPDVGRHTFGGILAQLDTPIKVAQKLLGHKEIASTEIYFHMRDKSLDKAMKGFDSL